MLHPLPPDDSIRRIISMQNEKILKIIFSIIENHFKMHIDNQPHAVRLATRTQPLSSLVKKIKMIKIILPSSVVLGGVVYGVVVGFGVGRLEDKKPRGFKECTCVTSADTITDNAKIA